MKAGIIFTGTGPILVLTSFESFSDESFIRKMEQKNIRKFMAVEVPVELCKQRYAQSFTLIMNDLHQDNDLRVLDYNGHSVLNAFKFDEWGPEIRHEAA